MKLRIGKWFTAAGVVLGLALGAAAPSAQGAVLAQWTFETTPPTTAGPYAPDAGIFPGGASASHASTATVYSNPAGNGSMESYSANNWTVGDYWQFTTSTANYESIAIQWDQTSSNTGPRDFQLSWSTDGTNFTPLGAPYMVLANAAPNPVWNTTTHEPIYTFGPIAAPAAMDDQATIYFRLVNTSTVSANGGTVASAGTNRIDNVTITGELIPEPASLGLVAGAGVLLLMRRRA